MELVFEPGNGTDLLPFGLKRTNIKADVLAQLESQTPPGEPEIDMYRSEGLILGYDTADRLEFIEVTHPSSCLLGGIALLGDLKNVLVSMSAQGHKAPFEDGSYDFKDLGIVLYCPSGTIESAAIYQEGYYD